MPTPIHFKLRDIVTTNGMFGGMPPFQPSALPMSWNTPFGITNSDIKGPTIPKPILFAVNGLRLAARGVFHPVCAMNPYPSTKLLISGVTKDEMGAAAGGYTVYLFNVTSGRPVLADTTISDGSGNYSFSVGIGEQYWAVDYKVGPPDKAGATLNTLVGTGPA